MFRDRTEATMFRPRTVPVPVPVLSLIVTQANKIKPNETRAWFSGPIMPSSQEADEAYSTAAGSHTGQLQL